MAILNSYMVTNRANPSEGWNPGNIYPLPGSDNFYFLAAGANNPNSQQYQQVDPNPTGSMPSNFQSRLEADIASAVQSGGPQVTVLIHGMSYVLSDACELLGTCGQNLASQGYKGLLIGFSWPSYGSAGSVHYYGSLPYSFPPMHEFGTIRDNIHGSTKSLLNLLNQIVPLCEKYGAQLNLMCHSEGNYMIMLAMYALSRNPDPALSQLAGAGKFMDQGLLIAADINNGALEPAQGSPPVTGQGASIAQYSKTATVYWSSKDTMLPFSDDWTDYHNPSFPLRLGLHGLHSYASGAILPNAYGLDCSLVANGTNPHIPPFKSVHESYFYIPQILLDMTQTLSDVPPADVVNRVSTGNQSFQMTCVPAPLISPFQPRGTRLSKEAPANS
jgi:hypothetical protein